MSETMTKAIFLAATMLAFTGGIASAQESPAPTLTTVVPVVTTLVIFTVLMDGSTNSTTNATTSN